MCSKYSIIYNVSIDVLEGLHIQPLFVYIYVLLPHINPCTSTCPKVVCKFTNNNNNNNNNNCIDNGYTTHLC